MLLGRSRTKVFDLISEIISYDTPDEWLTVCISLLTFIILDKLDVYRNIIFLFMRLVFIVFVL